MFINYNLIGTPNSPTFPKIEEWTALINLQNRNNLVIKAAGKGGATVVWRTDLYQQEAIRQLSDQTFYTKVNKDLTAANQKIVKDTIQELITKQ